MEKILADLQPTLTPVDFNPVAGGEILLTAPATEPQKEIWLSVQMGDDANCAFNESQSLRLRGQLDVEALGSSLQELVDRHEALRTTFSSDGSTLCIASSLILDIPFVDLSNLSVCERDIQLAAFLRQEVEQPFDLVRGPLFRVQIVRLQEREHLVILTAHHIVCDGWSWGVLVPELGTLYSALGQGVAADLKEPFRFSEYALLQAQQALSPECTAAEEYWLGQFSNQVPVLDLPTDRPRPPLRSFNGASSNWKVNSSLVSELKRLGAKVRCSFVTILLAGFEVFLYRLSGQEDIVVGMPAAGQAVVGQYNLVGHCANLLPLWSHIKGEQSFNDYLRTRRSTMLDAYEYQQFTFGSLLKKLALSRESSRIPLVSVIFNLDQAIKGKDLQFFGLDVELFSNPKHFVNFEMCLDACESSDGLDLKCEYNTDLFDAQTICRRLEEFEVLLAGIVADPDQLISKLPILPETEQQLLNDWNATDVAYPKTSSIHEMFEKQVERSPDAIAVVFEGEQLTYLHLNQRANTIAHYLQSLGVGPEVLVGICVERSLEMIVGLLGILKAGGAYMPLDPVYPQRRLAFMLSDAEIGVVLTQERLLDKLPYHKAQVVCLDSNWQDIAQETQENPCFGAVSENLAYVIYTSGSTGKPKGVMIDHRNVSALLHGFEQVAPRVEPLISTFVCPYSFDLSVWEIFSNLCFGGTLHILLPEIFANPESFASYLINHHVTTTYIPPALLSDVATELEKQSNSITLNRILVGVEPIKQGILQRFLHMSPAIRIVNGYGPTETTICATFYNFCGVTDEDRRTPIGTAVQNYIVYIFDHHLQPVPIGVPGELYIGGAGLARGYLNRPDLTDEKFIPHPWSNEPGSRLYKTGDKARYNRDGNIEFLGRIDHQVKIRGFRIELGEIEAAIALHPAVQETVVVAREDVPDRKYLAAYIVPNNKSEYATGDLRDFLKAKLPDYMIPGAFVILSALPLTPNGKVDRLALPKPDTAHQEQAAAFVPPRDTVEQQLQRIWSEVLQLPTVGVGDNFFELGGHSLLAVRLMATIEQCFGKNLPLAILFSSSTIEQLAIRLRCETDSLPWSPLVVIQSGGDKPPFFCVPGVGGNVICLYELARHLGLSQPFYGLQALGLDGESEPFNRVEDIAAYYIEAMQTFQPRGPYLLGGHSFGGVVAFEMAIQLQKQGHEVALVAIIDAIAPIVGNKPNCLDEEEATYLSDFASYIEYMFSLNLEVSKETLASFSHIEQLHYLKEWLIRVNLLPPDAEITLVRGLVQVYMASLKAHRSYLPSGVLPTRIALFRAQDIDEKEGDIEEHLMMLKEPTLGWKEMSGTVDVHMVPGNHMTMMQKPQVQALAEQLKVAIDAVLN